MSIKHVKPRLEPILLKNLEDRKLYQLQA